MTGTHSRIQFNGNGKVQLLAWQNFVRTSHLL